MTVTPHSPRAAAGSRSALAGQLRTSFGPEPAWLVIAGPVARIIDAVRACDPAIVQRWDERTDELELDPHYNERIGARERADQIIARAGRRGDLDIARDMVKQAFPLGRIRHNTFAALVAVIAGPELEHSDFDCLTYLLRSLLGDHPELRSTSANTAP